MPASAVNRGQFNCRIISRTERVAPKEYRYTVQLADGTTRVVVEKTSLKRTVGDEYIISIYDDPSFNVFVKKL